MDLRLFTNRVHTAAAGQMVFGGAALFGGQIVMPLYFQLQRSEPIVDTGLLLPFGLGAAATFPLAGRLTDRYGGGRVAAAGLPLTALATIPMALIGPDASLVGENALYMASVGYRVVGIDGAPTAVGRARAKARQANLTARFLVADAFDLDAIGQHFATVVDSAFLHTLPDAPSRRVYTGQLAGALCAGGRVHLLQIAESAPAQYPRLTREQIVDAFDDRWGLAALQDATYAVTVGEVPAWLVTMTLASSADDPTVAKATDLAADHQGGHQLHQPRGTRP